jgi:hypothetical protein
LLEGFPDMRQAISSWLSDLAIAVGGAGASLPGDSDDGARRRDPHRRSLRSFVVALACGLVLALLNGSAWAYRPGGGQSFAAPPARPAPAAASPRVSTPLLAPRPKSAAPAVLRSSGWVIPNLAAPEAPTEEAAAAAPDPAPPYQPTRNPSVFAALMLVGGGAAVAVALVRSRRTGNAPNVEHDVGHAPVGPVGTPYREPADRFHAVGSALGPAALGPQMPLVLAGKPLRGDGMPLPLMGELVQGTYRVGKELERDELGVMFQACHEQLDAPVRLYFLLPEHADSPTVQAQLFEMVRGWAQTKDPHRPVFDVGTTEDGRVFVVFAA